MLTFQNILFRLTDFWSRQGCVVHQGYDLEMGAGTFNPTTFLRSLGPEPYKAAYIEPSRRPTDGRYGENPNRLQHYFQYQVILKPSPENIQSLFIQSLEEIGFDLSKHDLRFVQDDWESPTLGASGLGWEVWMDGMEVTQFTYFQNAGGQQLSPVTGEITYGIERLAMYLQGVDSVYDLKWNDELTYGDIYQRNEYEFSRYNFEEADTDLWFKSFEEYEKEAKKLAAKELPLPAYDFVIKASHAFNMLDARGVISVTERTGYITRVRNLACLVAESYVHSREKQGYPLLKKVAAPAESTKIAMPSLSPSLAQPKIWQKEDFLLEIGSEEIPSGYILKGLSSLENLVKLLLEKEQISFGTIKAYGAPRRLSLHIEDMALTTKEIKEKKRGPSVQASFDEEGNPTKAAIGFFRSLNIEPLPLQKIEEGAASNISIEEVKGTKYLFAITTLLARPVAALLQQHLPQLILQIEFPKKMRWGDHSFAYARPLRWIVCLLGKDVVPFEIGPIVSKNISYAHRQLASNAEISIDHPNNYLSLLEKHFVLADHQERKKRIAEFLDEEEKARSCRISNLDLINDVMHLSEWPQLQTCSFDKKYLSVPKEVLISEMVEHQYYFPMLDKQGGLLPHFLVVVDNTPSEEIQKGNQKAIVPRFADGQALYQEDLATSLDKLLEKEKQITFQKELGSLYEKTQRLIQTSAKLQQLLGIGDAKKVQEAAKYSKCDLGSKMVFEFPELQGTMGKYFALHEGKQEEVALAIEEHWMPLGEEGELPLSQTGLLLSLADKFDNIVGCFACGFKPSSSSDPYALRRQVLGIIRMVLQNKLHLSLDQAIRSSADSYIAHVQKQADTLVQEIVGFFQNRIKTVFKGMGLAQDEIEAALAHGFDNIYDSFLRVEALKIFKEDKHFKQLYEVYRRAKGQVQDFASQDVDPYLLKMEAEKELYEEITRSNSSYNQAIKEYSYSRAYALLADLQPKLARLFDEVKILDSDEKIRMNRIALLQEVFNRFEKLLDFSKIKS